MTDAALLRVTLRAQPSDAAIAVHPLVDFGFAFETRNVNRLDTRTLGQDIPVVLGNSHRFETYFCFGHALLWQQFEFKSKGMAQNRIGENRSPIPRQLPSSPMMIFARRVKHSINVTVQRQQDADARKHGRPR
jgi:hypothetical protein